MNEKISNMFNSTRKFLGKHSPEILTGIGIAGWISTTILAVKATPKAMQLKEDEIRHQNDVNTKEALEAGAETCVYLTKLKPLDLIKTCWKPYAPAVGLAIVSTSCLIGSNAIHYKRNAALATVYAISERTLLRYKDKVVETLGEKKEKEIADKVAQENVNQNKVSNQSIIITSKGNTLCMDAFSGRYFRSDIDSIKKAINKINRDMTYDHYVSLNTVYGEMGLDNVKNGELLGWNLDNGLIEPSFSTCLAENDEPCVVIDYYVPPKYDFDKLM